MESTSSRTQAGSRTSSTSTVRGAECRGRKARPIRPIGLPARSSIPRAGFTGDVHAAQTGRLNPRSGQDITNHPIIQGAIGEFQTWRNVNLSGLQVFLGGVDWGVREYTPNANEVYLTQDFFNFSKGGQYEILGHEFQHIVQWRSVPFFGLRYIVNNLLYGRENNPYEVGARQVGRDFRDHMIPGR